MASTHRHARSRPPENKHTTAGKQGRADADFMGGIDNMDAIRTVELTVAPCLSLALGFPMVDGSMRNIVVPKQHTTSMYKNKKETQEIFF